jgi:hypothetical protein
MGKNGKKKKRRRLTTTKKKRLYIFPSWFVYLPFGMKRRRGREVGWKGKKERKKSR